MEYCYHVWVGAFNCYLDMLDMLLKHIFMTVGPLLAASHEPLTHRRTLASWSIFYRYYCGRCSSELVELVPLSHSLGRSIRYSNRWHSFFVTVPRCYKGVYVNSFSPSKARLLNSWPAECFPLTCGLNSFNSRVKKHLSFGSF